jgi:methylenetetrahydrofolate reductase (NADPH)
LSVGVAGYPEGHIDALDLFADIENLKKKVDAGADAIYTQLFFNNDKFFSYVQLVRDAGIEVPIIPGIMPIISKKQVEKMTALANIGVPKSLWERIERCGDSPDDMKKLGIEFATIQCQQLIDAEVRGLHFYTLNKAYSTAQILENIL